jgi:hypothetical protein
MKMLKNSVDLFLRGNFTIGQIRQFSLTEKIKIKSKKFQNYQNSLVKNQISLNDSLNY